MNPTLQEDPASQNGASPENNLQEQLLWYSDFLKLLFYLPSNSQIYPNWSGRNWSEKLSHDHII